MGMLHALAAPAPHLMKTKCQTLEGDDWAWNSLENVYPNSYRLVFAFVVELLHSKADQMDTECEQFHAVNLHEEKGKEIEGIT